MNRTGFLPPMASLALCSVLVLVSCHSKDSGAPGPPGPIAEDKEKVALVEKGPAETESGLSEPEKDDAAASGADSPTATGTGLTESMREAFGAATIIPADASYFSSTLRLKEQWNAVVNSRAMRKLLELPGAQMLRQQILQSPPFLEFQQQLQRNPLLSRALDVISDAVSHEVFFYGDARVPEVIDALWSVYGAMFLPDSAARGARPFSLRRGVETMVELKDKLRFPGIVIGFALSKPDAARELLADLLKQLDAAGVGIPLLDQKIGEGQYHTLLIGGRMVPPPLRAELTRALLREGLPPVLVSDFDALVSSRTLAISVGLLKKHLLLSLGSGTEHLGRLGQRPSLAESPALDPARSRFKDGLVSLVYIAKELTFSGKLRRDEAVAMVDNFLETVPAGELPDGLPARLKKDVGQLVDDINSQTPDASPVVSVTFKNRGLESFTFSAKGSSNLDTRRPLTLLGKAGAAPIAVVASRGKRSQRAYELFAHWVGVGKGYFEDLMVPKMSPEDRVEYRRFHDLFVPALKDLDAATRELLIPAVDGFQGALVADGAGTLRGIPGTPVSFAEPIRVPRPALMLEVNDPEKLKQAFARYRDTANRFIQRAAKSDIGLDPFVIPEPETRPFAGGTLYTYRLPVEIGGGFEPHALLVGNLVVLSLFPEQSKSLLEATARWDGEVVDLAGAAGRAYRIDLRGLVNLIAEDVGIVLRFMAANGVVPAETVTLVSTHLPAAREALGAFRSFSGRVYTEGEYLVHHSWLNVVDLEEKSEAGGE